MDAVAGVQGTDLLGKLSLLGKIVLSRTVRFDPMICKAFLQVFAKAEESSLHLKI